MLSLASGLVAEVYKWTDEKGKTHYSDKPVVFNESVKKLKINTNKDKKPIHGKSRHTLYREHIENEKKKQKRVALEYNRNLDIYKRNISGDMMKDFREQQKKDYARNSGMNEKTIKSRMKTCRRNGGGDCTRKDIVRHKAVEDYDNSIIGRQRNSQARQNHENRRQKELSRFQN